MKNERRIFKRLADWLAVCVFAVVVAPALADVPPAYPPQNTPAIQQMATARTGQTYSYSSQTGRMTIGEYQPGQVPRATFARATPSLGQRSHPVSLTNNYGAVATGTIQTQTAMPQTSTMAKAAAALYGAQVFGSAAKHQAPNVGQAIANGDYKGATQYAVEGLLQGLKESGDAVLFGGIGGVESGFQAYKDAQQAKAQQAFDKAEQDSKYWQQQYDPSLKTVTVWYMENIQTKQREIFLITGKYFGCCRGISTNAQGMVIGSYLFRDNGERYIVPPYKYDEWSPISEVVQNSKELYERRPTVEDVMLSQAEIQAIMAKQLEQMLNDNNRNHTELMNALWNAGVIGPGNTQTMVSGSPADNTFLTSPFTPAGSDQAQQTQFVVNNNGTVTQTTINRPDLVANTSQAPTRAEVGTPAHSQSETRQQKDGSTAEAPDVCAKNPNSLMCAPLEAPEYSDPVLPTEQRGLDFNPASIFPENGVCPKPKTINVFNTQVNLNYEPMCDMAVKLRAFVILTGMLLAMFMVYGVVNNE